MINRKALIVLLLAAAVVLFFDLDLGRHFSLDYLKAQQQSLREFTNAHPLQSYGLFFAGYVALTAISFPGAAVMTVAAGALYGAWWGTVIVSFASTLGALLAFLGARYLLRDFVERHFGRMLGPINAGIERDGEFYLFTLRLVPAFPFFVINLAMGLTRMRAWPFFWISQVGMLAGTFVYVNAGTQLGRISSLNGILSLPVLLSFAALGLFPLLARKITDLLKQRRAFSHFDKPEYFDFNLAVIGAGSGGLVSAYLGATLKARTVLIEKHHMGGDCLNTGCVPSKTLLRSAKIASYMRRSAEFGLQGVEPQVDFAEVMARVRRAIAAIEPHDSVARYTGLGVECVQGEARLLSPWLIKVGNRQITARNIIIATGAKPAFPPLPGLDQAPYVTSDTIWQLDTLPARLLIIGGGPIGCEFAQAFCRLGSRVTIVDIAPRLLLKEDEDAASFIADRLRAEGVDLHLGHAPVHIECRGGDWRLTAVADGVEVDLSFDRLLLATGRRANTEGLGLAELAITLKPDGTIEVDDYLRTSVPNIFAVGDVIGHYQFTHTAARQAYYAVVNAFFGSLKKTPVDYSVIPWTTFTDPEVARVGLNEQQAKERGIVYEVTRYDVAELDRAIAEEEAHGFVKVLTAPGKDRILGATIVAPHAGELIAEFVLAMRHRLGLSKILGTIHVYPTLAEANKFVAGAWRRSHSSPLALRWLQRYHRWRRENAANWEKRAAPK